MADQGQLSTAQTSALSSPAVSSSGASSPVVSPSAVSPPAVSQPGASSPGAPAGSRSAVPVVVKKYANRRLYNTETSSYITQDNLAEMVKAGRDFVVYDARTGEDITRGVLTQIIVDAESKGSSMLPTPFLRHLIGFYGDSLQSVVPRYLEQAMASFAHQQQQMRQAYQQAMTPFLPFGMEEVSRQNMAIMERAMSLFSPFYRPGGAEAGKAEGGKAEAAKPDVAANGAAAAPAAVPAEELTLLKEEVERLRGELAAAKARAEPAKPRVVPLPVAVSADPQPTE